MLTQEQFNERCYQAFCAYDGDEYYSIRLDKNGDAIINMGEISQDGQFVIFDYYPDMSDRPQALAYLLGKRDNFND